MIENLVFIRDYSIEDFLKKEEEKWKCLEYGEMICCHVDSIILSILVEKPDFDHPEELKKQIEKKTIEFINDIISMLNE